MNNSFDVCIIGGGAAGMVAALSVTVHHPKKSVVLIDQSRELGRKLLVAGAGRGNVTNTHLATNPTLFLHGDNTIITNIVSQFGYDDITRFFTTLGIALYEEQKTGKGKIFPVINHAKTVRDILVDEIMRQGITVRVDTKAQSIKKNKIAWEVKTTTDEITATDLILACGGNAYPSFGSDGSGYVLAQSIGHTIIDPIPSAVPLVSKNPLSHLLQGEKMELQVTIPEVNSGTVGDVLFTQYGVSGTAILSVSRAVSLLLHREHKNTVSLDLSFFPDNTKQEVQHMVEERWKNNRNQFVARSLWGLLTTKVAAAVCMVADIPKERTVNAVTQEETKRLVETLTSYRLFVTDTRGWNEAEFTLGGVCTDEVNPKTLASNKVDHLYVAGELLDVDGDIGGFNLSWAWSSGWVSGKLQQQV